MTFCTFCPKTEKDCKMYAAFQSHCVELVASLFALFTNRFYNKNFVKMCLAGYVHQLHFLVMYTKNLTLNLD